MRCYGCDGEARVHAPLPLRFRLMPSISSLAAGRVEHRPRDDAPMKRDSRARGSPQYE